jgi:AraC-like DNA-binding protein
MKEHLDKAFPSPALRASELSSELVRRIASLIGSAEKRVSEIPGLSLHQRTAPTDLCPATYEPSVMVVAQGRKQVELGQNTFIYGPSRYLLTSIDLPVVSRVVEATEETPCLVILLKLEMATIRELLSLEEIQFDSAPSDSLAMVTGETTPEFLDACCRLLALLETPRDIPFLGGLIKREIIYRVLQGNAGPRLRDIATPGDHHQRTAKAIAWIKTNYVKPIRVEELAQIAGMSVSTFHHYFRVMTAMSPLQYQKRLRLQEARRRMLLDGLDAASAAFEVGYESASQFNREYSRLFGQPPMRDIRALRTSDAPEPVSVGG